jgi:hypothetical protein
VGSLVHQIINKLSLFLPRQEIFYRVSLQQMM